MIPYPSLHQPRTRAAFFALLAKFQGKPHCETKHSRPREGQEDEGRKGEKGKNQGRRAKLAGENGKSVSRMLSKPVNALKPKESKTCFRN